MARYCVRCGKKLEDDEICSCRVKQEEQADGRDFNKAGSGIAYSKLLRVWDPNYSSLEACYESGRQIVPDLVVPCEGETPIRQYHLVNLRSRLQGLWAEGRLMVTNKRLLFRASGRSFFGRTIVENEYSLEEISGLRMSHNVRFCWFDFLVSLVLLVLTGYLSVNAFLMGFLSGVSWGWLLALTLVGAVGLVLLSRPPKNRWKMIICVVMGAMLLKMGVERHGAPNPLAFVMAALAVVHQFMSAMKPVVSLNVMCKTGTAVAIDISGGKPFRFGFGPEMLPTAETDRSIREVGAIIHDIQRMGDYGIRKWQETERPQ